MQSFKEKFPVERRKIEAKRILIKYPDRIPIIVEKAFRSNIPDIDKNKYLVPRDITLGQFIFIIRKRIRLTPEEALFIFIGNTLPKASGIISQIYNEMKEEDGFLYMTYTAEDTFG